MDCRDARARLAEDPKSRDPDLVGHLDVCEDCAAHANEALGLMPPTPDDLSGLLAEVEADLAREVGRRAWLRSRSTPVRAALALLLAVALSGGVAVLLPRPDLAVVAPLRFGLTFAALLVSMAVTVWAGLRPLGLGLPRWSGAAAVAALAVVVGVAGLPEAHAGHPASVLHPSAFWHASATCLSFGAFAGAPLVALLYGASRDDSPRLGAGAWMTALSGGVLGVLALHLHCPVVSQTHLLIGHVMVVPALLVIPVVRWRLS